MTARSSASPRSAMTPASTIAKTDHSALQFDRVWVREVTFIDNPEETEPTQASAAELGIRLEVSLRFSEDNRLSFVTLRAVLDPPSGKPLFTKLTAAVEGLFRMSDGDPQRLQEFSRLQAPVLLLPYLRTAISTMTAESRLSAVILPPLNMTQLVHRMNEALEAGARSQQPAAG